MKEIDLEEIGVKHQIYLDDKIFDIPSYSLFLSEDIHRNIIDYNKNYRCHYINDNTNEVIGGYGIIYFATRYDKYGVKKCSIKKSIDLSYNVLNESILQNISYNVLKKHKLEYMIPKVFDVFKKDNNIYFSMERIFGEFIHIFLLNSKNPEKDFILCLLQISIILHILEKTINLDHRDLRVTNIFVVNTPKELKFTIDHKTYLYNCDYHICLLDFGFACIGNKPTIINATEEMFNKNERCFKPGRDLFQLLISILSLESIKNRFSYTFYNKLVSLLINKKHNYINLLKSNSKALYKINLL